MKIILLGAPGVGKGTQAERISNKLGIPAISTGLIIRHAIAAQNEVGKLAKGYIDKGQLVPDEVVIKLLLDRLKESDCEKGFILDGFPRTIPQAQALIDNNVNIDAVVDIELEDDEILSRLSGRRECSECGKTYHLIWNKPSKDGICDSCGASLVRRHDDEPDTIKKRLVVYHNQTEPLKTFYREKGLMAAVRSQEGVEETTKEVFKALGVNV